MLSSTRTRLCVALVSAFCALQAVGGSVTILPSKDNTLIEPMPKGGLFSTGLGSLYCGRTGAFAQFTRRRCVLAFDIAGAVPAGSIIRSASLAMRLEIGTPGDRTHTLHKVLADWGEGTSAPGGFGLGAGTPATTGDVTWVHRFYDTQMWTNAGGDFTALASASTIVGSDIVDYVWTSPQMACDVQNWLDAGGGGGPATNFGWIMLGDEVNTTTAKGFYSREAFDQSVRPRLTIDFIPPGNPCPGDVNGTGSVDVDDLITVILHWGACDPCPPACEGDTNKSHAVDVDDLIAVILGWGPCP